MKDEIGQMNKKHTSNRVPFLINQRGLKFNNDQGLSNIAPTLLTLLGLDIPQEMTALSLLKKS
jgi:2,3-bisphosphoglycerate-independent phosphoglycerate mutase